MKKHTEVVTVEHKGIEITIHINYDRGELSLVESGNFNGFNKKSWIFANRTLDYMNGWLNTIKISPPYLMKALICSSPIDAMKFAIEFGKKQLEHDLAEKSAFKSEKIIKDFIEPYAKNKRNKKNNIR